MVNQAKKAIDDFEYMRSSAEARALSKISLERRLTPEEFARYKEVCEKIGIKV
jgi:phage gp16-like protein